MKIQELLEIGFAHGVGQNTIDDQTIISNSKLIGNIDSMDVYLFKTESQEVFFFEKDSKLSAFVVIVNNDLRGIKNISNIPGQITALMMFITKHLKRTITIPKTEALTPQGFSWLKSLIAAKGRGLTITDQSGKFPDITNLEKEWNNAKHTDIDGPTSITIENELNQDFPLFNERLLMPVYKYIGKENLI